MYLMAAWHKNLTAFRRIDKRRKSFSITEYELWPLELKGHAEHRRMGYNQR
jgi:hypothetical protein